jgi:hypothetical protein
LAVRKLRGGATGAETPFDLKVVELGYNQTTCVIEWRQELAQTSSTTGKTNPWKSLKVFRTSMQVALADHGKMSRPFGNDGPQLRVVPLHFVRTEFMASYPAEKGDNEEQKQNTKRKAYQRQLKLARERNLICTRDLNGEDQAWLVSEGDK